MILVVGRIVDDRWRRDRCAIVGVEWEGWGGKRWRL